MFMYKGIYIGETREHSAGKATRVDNLNRVQTVPNGGKKNKHPT